MPRIRYLKPDFFDDEDLCRFPYETRIGFAGLWCYADREGRLEDRPEYLKVKIFPYDNVDFEKEVLAPLLEKKPITLEPFIVRYEVSGRRYIQILNFKKHQRPHHTEKESVLPPMENGESPVKPPLNTGEAPLGKGMEKGMGNGELGIENGELGEDPMSGKPDPGNWNAVVCGEIVGYLNEKAEKRFRATSPETRRLIKVRMKQGFSVEDFRRVIDHQVAKWKDDPKMMDYLRPQTLFGTKFEGYLNSPPGEMQGRMTEQGARGAEVAKNWLKKKGYEEPKEK
jgi:uncharacterized phage protein (TIGR02220 family)